RTLKFCNLNSHRTDPAARAMYQNCFAGLSVGESYEHVPCSESNERNCSSFREIQTGRNCDNIFDRQLHIFGVRAIVSYAEHTIFTAKIIPAAQTFIAMTAGKSG